jgi:hypothetical protein
MVAGLDLDDGAARFRGEGPPLLAEIRKRLQARLDVRRPAEILHEDDLTRRRLPNARAALLARELEIVSVKADGV